MRDKILVQLVAKFPGVSKQVLGHIATKLAKKVTDESGIEQSITDFDNAVSITDLANDFQVEGDRRVGDAKKEWDRKNPKPPADPKDPKEPKPNPGSDDEPAWLTNLNGQLKTMAETITALQREKVQGTMKSRATELLKDVPAKFWAGRALPEKEEDLQTFVESVNTDYTEFKQGLIDEGLMTATKPGGGGSAVVPPGPEGTKLNATQAAALDSTIDGWAKGKAPVATAADSQTKK